MRLTKDTKEEIITRVIRDVPRVHSDPEEFQKKVTAIINAAVADQAPVEVAQMWAQPRMRQHLNLEAGSIAYMVKHNLTAWVISQKVPFRSCDTTRPTCCNQLNSRHAKMLQEVFDKAWAEVERIEEIERNIRVAMNSIHTRKRLVETFPEFEKYAPKEPAKPMLPATLTNVITDLAKLGWPKDKEVAA